MCWLNAGSLAAQRSGIYRVPPSRVQSGQPITTNQANRGAPAEMLFKPGHQWHAGAGASIKAANTTD